MAETISRKSIVYDVLFNTGKAEKSTSQFGKEVDSVKGKLDAASKSVNDTSNKVDNLSKKTISAAQKLRQIKNELNNFTGTQQRFEALTLEAAQLQDQLDKTNQRIRVLASSTKNIQALTSAFTGAVGAITAVQGAQALFGQESENLNKALVKLQGSMALLQGVQAAVATVTEQSAAKTVLATTAQKAYNLVVGNSTGALKGFRIALAATGIGLAVIAVAALVTNWEAFTEAIGLSNKELEQQQKFMEEGIKSYSDEIANVQLLQKEYENANTTQERRTQIIQELKEINPSYFGDLSEEKGLYIDLSKEVNNYIEALKLKGLNEARLKKVAELSEKIVKLQSEEGGAGAFRNFSAIFKLQQEQEALLSKIVDDQNKIKGGFSSADTKSAADSINALNEKLSKLRDEFNSISPKDAKFPQLKQQIIDLEEEIRRLTERAKEAKKEVEGIIEFDPEKASAVLDAERKFINEALAMLAKASKTVNLLFIDEAQSGVAKEIDREQKYETLIKITQNFFGLIRWSLEIIEAYKIPSVNERKGSKVTEPESFSIKTEGQLMTDLNDMILKETPQAFIATTSNQIADKIYSDNEEFKIIVNILTQWDVLYGKSSSAISMEKANGGATQKDVLRHVHGYSILVKLARTEDFTKVRVEDIQTQIIDKAEAELEKLMPQETIQIPEEETVEEDA